MCAKPDVVQQQPIDARLLSTSGSTGQVASETISHNSAFSCASGATVKVLYWRGQ